MVHIPDGVGRTTPSTGVKASEPEPNESSEPPSPEPPSVASESDEEIERAFMEGRGAQQQAEVNRQILLKSPPADEPGDGPDPAAGEPQDEGGSPEPVVVFEPTQADMEAEENFMRNRASNVTSDETPTPVAEVPGTEPSSGEGETVTATITGFGPDGLPIVSETDSDTAPGDPGLEPFVNAGLVPDVGALAPQQSRDAVPQDADQTMQYLYDHHSEIDRSQRPDGIIDMKELYDYIASHQNIGEMRNIAFLQGNDRLFHALSNRYQEGGPGRNDQRGISLLDLDVAANAIGPASQGTVEEKAAQLSVALTGQFGQVSPQQVLQGTAPRPGETSGPPQTGLVLVGNRWDYNALYNTVAAIANNTTPHAWTDESGKARTMPANAGQQLLNWVAQNARVEVSVNRNLDPTVAGIVGFNGDGVYYIQLRDPTDATFLLHESLHVFTRSMGLSNSIEEEETATVIGAIADPINRGNFVPDSQAPRRPDGSYQTRSQDGDRKFSLPELDAYYQQGYEGMPLQSSPAGRVGDIDQALRNQFGWIEGVHYPVIEPAAR